MVLALSYRAYQLQMANNAIIKRNSCSICRVKPSSHVLSDERVFITKAINIKPSDTLIKVAPMQQTTPQQYITRAGRQYKLPRWLDT